MIDWLSNWAEQIIVAVIIAGIIEMILPSGNNKKYIKAVIGVYILFTIISPIIEKFSNINLNNIDYEQYFEQNDTYQTFSENLTKTNNKSVEEIYLTNLKEDIKVKLNQKGYSVDNIRVNIDFKEDANYGVINEISLNAYTKEEKNEQEKTITNTININKIETVNIGNTIKNSSVSINRKSISNAQKEEVKEYLSSVYEVKKKNIKINE